MGAEAQQGLPQPENDSGQVEVEVQGQRRPLILGLQPSALVDHVARVDWSLLYQIPGDRGGSKSVAIQDLEYILSEVNTHILPLSDDTSPIRTMAGGSVANTIRGLSAGFGISCGLIGAYGDDEQGQLFVRNMGFNGVDLSRLQMKRGHTAQCACLVDADGNRTMRPCLSNAVRLQPDELSNEDFRGSKWLAVRYAFNNLDLIHAAVGIAKKEGVLVSMDLASFEMVRDFRLPLLGLLESGNIDLCFANEDEARELLRGQGEPNADPEAALRFLGRHCQWAVVTLGPKGCVAKHGEQVVRVPAIAEAKATDATGAGDLFAGGFLYGLVKGLSLEDCCKVGSCGVMDVKLSRRAGGHVRVRMGHVRVWVLRLISSVLIWTALIQLTSIAELWRPHLLPKGWPACLDRRSGVGVGAADYPNATSFSVKSEIGAAAPSPPALLPNRVYKNNGYLRVSCNGGLNQMRAAICDMVTIARYLNLTLLIPDLDKRSFWADPSDFGDIFNIKHFIDSLRDEVRIVKSLSRKFNRKSRSSVLSIPPVSWSSEKYYLKQILPLFRKHKVIHFNKSDARLANNGLPIELQKLRCRVNYQALRFTPQIEATGNKLISILRESGFFVVLHLRYEMDMLAFSGCTHRCSHEEIKELTQMRYAYPWWKEKEIVSEKKRLDGLCPLTPEETALVLQAFGFARDTQIYIASGEIYGGERRLAALRAAYPKIVRKEMLLSPDELSPFQNHSTQMAALDYLVSVASDVFIPSYDGNMAKVVEGHRRYSGFRKSILLDRRKLVELLDLHLNKTMAWDEFSLAVRRIHEHQMGQSTRRKVIPERPKEEDYFYANPQECLEHWNDQQINNSQ